ncbi:MAG: NAD kinase [Bifidobacteriaceae bacterium]|nr:NAD kinase [Bifidobacteriaceae bacterium]
MRSAVVVTHRGIAPNREIVGNVVDRLRQRGFSVRVVNNLSLLPFGTRRATVPDDTEIVIVLGGDGTILSAAELVRGTRVPILGINLGHVGFLAEFECIQAQEAIDRVADRDYRIDERTIATITAQVPGREPLADWALNEVTMEKADRSTTIETGIAIDNVPVTSFAADGVIVSTPTGSTAYAFSVGGPVIWPSVQALEIVPIAAHALFTRPLIVGQGSDVRIELLPDSQSTGHLTCDGRRTIELPVRSVLHITQSLQPLRLAHLSGASFTQRLVTKFELPVNGWRNEANGGGVHAR